MRISISTAVWLLLAGGAWAQAPAPDAAAGAPVAETPKPVKIICVRSQADTGSHFGAQKVCHTQAEWDMIHAQTTSTLQRYETIQNQQPSGGGR